MSEQLRRANNREKCLMVLMARTRVSNLELIEAAGIRAGGRIHELRKAGHRIRSEQGQGGIWWFTYEGPPQPPTQQGLGL